MANLGATSAAPREPSLTEVLNSIADSLEILEQGMTSAEARLGFGEPHPDGPRQQSGHVFGMVATTQSRLVTLNHRMDKLLSRL
jgi:hypothetical protein